LSHREASRRRISENNARNIHFRQGQKYKDSFTISTQLQGNQNQPNNTGTREENKTGKEFS
jgi:hypothetical protein